MTFSAPPLEGADSDGVDWNSTDHMPDDISEPLTNFYKDVSEQQTFVSFYHALARQIMSEGIEQNEEILNEYHGHSVFFLESYLIRMATFTENYLIRIIYEICTENTDFPKKAEIKRATKFLNRESDDEIIEEDILFEVAREIFRNYKYKIRQLLRERLSIDLHDTIPNWKFVEILFHIRNAVVHSDSIADRRSTLRMASYEYSYWPDEGELILIPELEVVTLVRRVERAISTFDKLIQGGVPIWTRSRFGHLYIPRHRWIMEKMEDRYGEN